MSQIPDSVRLRPDQLSLNKRETRLFPSFCEFLQRHPNPLGQVLLGIKEKPWCASDARKLEDLVGRFGGEEKQVAAFLAIAHNAAHYCSVEMEKHLTLPQFHVLHQEIPSATSFSLAAETARYRRWGAQLGAWMEALFPGATEHVANRDLLLASTIVSSMLYGGAYGVRVLAGIVRAIACHRERSFIVGGRVHVEVFLSWGMLAEGETRFWVPDALSACLWTWVVPEDVAGLLEPVSNWKGMRPPSDSEIFRRAERLIRSCCTAHARKQLGTISDLRRCCWAMAHPHLNPVMARYADSEISANSPSRKSLRRLFPLGQFVEFSIPQNPSCQLRPGMPEYGHAENQPISSGAAHSHKENPPDSPLNAGRPWVSAVCRATTTKDPCRALQSLVDGGGPEALLASFGISLLSSTSYTGKRMTKDDVARALKILGDSLAANMEEKDIAAIDSDAALEIYIRAIERRPVSQRLLLIKWILEFDLFIRVRLKTRDSIPLSKLPWPPEDGALDPGFVTHEEYKDILCRIDECWDVIDSPRRKRMIRLIVAIAFRLGIRGGEIKQLRLGHLLVRGEPEILLWPFKGDRFKTRNARRRVPLLPLLSKDELNDLIDWRQARLDEGATLGDRLFAIPEEKMSELPRWLVEDLNDFLRAQSTIGVDEGFLHVHTFRHACQCWMFTAMMLAEGGIGKSPFSDLELSNEWLARGRERLNALYGHDRHTAKHAFLQASLAGHGDFFTTARSYVHFFPWILSSFLEASPAMKPPERMVRIASGKPESTERTWRKGGIHNIAVQLLLHRYRDERVMIPESDRTILGPRPEVSALGVTWTLLRTYATTEMAIKADAATQLFLDRAIELAQMRRSDGTYRHRMESGRGGERLALPARPMRKYADSASDVWKKIAAGPSDLVRNGLRIFVGRVENNGWLRFAPDIDENDAKRYIRFLCEIGFGSQLVAMSDDIEGWKRRLGYQGIDLKWIPARGIRRELSIRPDLSPTTGGTRGWLRFALVMAYIRLGGEHSFEDQASLEDLYATS
jgi:integrase